MPDISMCTDNRCPRSEFCYRFKAVPDHWQSYSDFSSVCKSPHFTYFLEVYNAEIGTDSSDKV